MTKKPRNKQREPSTISIRGGEAYLSDSPISDPKRDRFRRWPFALRLAQTISARKDSSSIVVAIYGAWGDGKTTVLNFINRELQSHPDVVCIKFNPWRFGDETQLLRSYFKSVSDGLGRSLNTARESIGKWLDEYATLLSPASLALTGTVGISPTEGVRQIGKKLSSVDLETHRQRIEQFLFRCEKKSRGING